jgi:type I restriction enzyme S subunit
MSIINGQSLIIDRSLLRSERLRQAILKLAFEGRIAEQDPNDEPGRSLLERIKTDRGASGTGQPPARQRRAATAKIKLEARS